MRRAVAGSLVAWCLTGVAACSSEKPAAPAVACHAAQATQLTLAVAAYTSIDPASDVGCTTFPANASVDSAEYLVVAQSTGGERKKRARTR